MIHVNPATLSLSMPTRTLFLGADHAGFELKESLKPWLHTLGFEVCDLSPRFDKDDDYPIHGMKVALAVTKTKNSFGILVCGSGVGISIAANRIQGARAFDAFDTKTVTSAREHTDANIIALSGWHLSPAKAKSFITLFLKTAASKEARHKRRIKQLG